MPITTGYKALVASAMAEVVTYTVAEVQARLDTLMWPGTGRKIAKTLRQLKAVAHNVSKIKAG